MRIIVTSKQLAEFARTWPCCHFPEDLGVSFEYDSYGNLVDIEWFNGWSGKTVFEPDLSKETERALSAVSQDAQLGKIGSGPV
jgi:hypothetical protein